MRKKAVELALQTNTLLPFIRSAEGIDEVNISNPYWSLLEGRCLQFIRASVSPSILLHIQGLSLAFATYAYLEQMYSGTRGYGLIVIYKRLINLIFKVGYDVEHFTAEFESVVEDFLLAGVSLHDEFKVVVFLEKLPYISEPGTLYSTFYHTK